MRTLAASPARAGHRGGGAGAGSSAVWRASRDHEGKAGQTPALTAWSATTSCTLPLLALREQPSPDV